MRKDAVRGGILKLTQALEKEAGMGLEPRALIQMRTMTALVKEEHQGLGAGKALMMRQAAGA